MRDLDRDILQWVGPDRAMDEQAYDADGLPPRSQTEVPLSVAVAAMRESLDLPGMWGVLTTVQMFGPFVRWQLWQIDRPDLRGPEEVGWQPAAVRVTEAPLPATSDRSER